MLLSFIIIYFLLLLYANISPPGFHNASKEHSGIRTRMHVPGLGPLDLARRRREVLARFQICTPSGGRDARGWEEPPHVLSGKRPETEKPRC